MKTILLGVSASISAYKSADIISQLKKNKLNVEVVMTEHSKEFITPLTLQSLAKTSVHTNVMEEIFPEQINHIDIAKRADLFLIAPASANMIGKIANGIADNMLSTVALAVHDIPCLFAPAMNTHMYNNKAVKRNIETLINDGYQLIEPRVSQLACGDIGKGALADVDVIINRVLLSLNEKVI